MVTEYHTWNEGIDLTYLHTLYSSGHISLIQMVKGVIAILKKTNSYNNSSPAMVDIVCELENISKYDNICDYNIILEMLFDLGDDERIWVNSSDNEKLATFNLLKATSCAAVSDFDEDTKPDYNSPVKNYTTTQTYSSKNTNSYRSSYSYGTERRRSIRFLTQDEFNKRLSAHDIDPTYINKELYEFMKEVDDDFQEWLINRWVDIATSGGEKQADTITL